MVRRYAIFLVSLIVAGGAATVFAAPASAEVRAVAPSRPLGTMLPRSIAPSDRGVAADVARARNVRDLGRLRGQAPISVGVLMRVRNEAQLKELTLLQSNRHSPLYHHYLTPAQFAAYFSPDVQTYHQTILTLERRGFRVTQTFPNRTFIRAIAPAATVERYFSTELHSVVQAEHGTRYMNVRPALMPAELRASAVSVAGLHSVVTMHHPLHFADRSLVMHSLYYARALAQIRAARERIGGGHRDIAPVRRHPENVPTPIGTSTPAPNPSPDAGVTPGTPSTEYANSIGGYGPDIYVNAYDYPVQHGYGGHGRAAGSVIEADYLDSDANLEFTTFGIPRTGHATRVCPDPAGGPSCYGAIGNPDPIGEATLDALTIMSMAPAADFYEYLAPAFDDLAIETAYEGVVNDNFVEAVNSSFGGCETDDPSFGYATNYIAMEGASVGITFEASTGDTGATNCGAYATNGAPQSEFNVSLPSSDEYFTAVGGTDFYQVSGCTGVGSNCYTKETAWTFGGGGYSVFTPIPPWQACAVSGQPTTSVGSTTMRNTPDVVFTADSLPPGVGIAIYYNGFDSAIGGTSVASPMFTALQVEINQIQHSRNGLVSPGLYAIECNATEYAFAFRDVVGGTNERYTAIPGYDDASGIGSPLGWELAATENGQTPVTTPLATPTASPTPSSATPSPSPSPSPSPMIVPSPVGTNFIVTTYAGSTMCSASTDGVTNLGSGGKACFSGPTGIIYIPSNPTGQDTQSSTDNYLFVNDFNTGFLRSIDIATNAVVSQNTVQWNNHTRAVAGNPQSLLYGLAYLGPTSPNVATFGGLYVLAAGDDAFNQVTLPTSPNPATTPFSALKVLTGGPAAGDFNTAGNDAGIVATRDGTLHLGQFAGAIDDDVTASSALPNGGNYGITMDGAGNYVITDSAMNEIIKATDTASSMLTTFATGKPLNLPKEITYLSSTSSFYVANCGGNNIVKVTNPTMGAPVMTVVAGDGAAREFDGDNTGAEFICPFGITNDGTNLYVTDLGANTIRKITNVI